MLSLEGIYVALQVAKVRLLVHFRHARRQKNSIFVEVLMKHYGHLAASHVAEYANNAKPKG